MQITRILCVFFILIGSLLGQSSSQQNALAPGQPWKTVDGQIIQAHGAGIIQVGNTWYWIGENKTHGASFYANSCYSSTDLVHWKFVNDTLKLQPSGDLGPKRVVERPKILYNAKTKTYVMYMHIDDPKYGEARVGVATSSTVCGDYTYRGSFQPLGFQSRDLGLFQDDDGSAYLLTEDRVNGLRIDALSSDYLTVTKPVAVFPDMEAPAILKANGRYYMFCSHLTGWEMNDNQYATAASLAGPWSPLKNFVPAGSKTFNSQTTYVLPVKGKARTTYIYMGDRWVPNNLVTSSYIWLPLTIDGDTVSLEWRDRWSLNAAAGTWTPAK